MTSIPTVSLFDSKLSVVLTKLESEESRCQISRVEKLYPCDACKKSFLTPQGLRCHGMHCGRMQSQYVCRLCSLRFPRSVHLASHVRLMHMFKRKKERFSNGTSAAAKKRQTKTTKQQYLAKSKKSTVKISKQYVCPKCDHRYDHIKTLESHIKNRCATSGEDSPCHSAIGDMSGSLA